MKVVLKWLLVVALVIAAGWLFHIPVDSEKEPYRALAYGAGGLVCIVVAAGFVIVPLGRLALGVVDALFMPAGTYTPPPCTNSRNGTSPNAAMPTPSRSMTKSKKTTRATWPPSRDGFT